MQCFLCAKPITTYRFQTIRDSTDSLYLDVDTDTECYRIEGSREVTVYQKKLGELHGEGRIVCRPGM